MLHSVQVRNNLIGGEKRDILMSAFEVGKKSRKMHGRGSENSRLGVAIAPSPPCGYAPGQIDSVCIMWMSPECVVRCR